MLGSAFTAFRNYFTPEKLNAAGKGNSSKFDRSIDYSYSSEAGTSKMDTVADRSLHDISTDSLGLTDDISLEQSLYRTANESGLFEDDGENFQVNMNLSRSSNILDSSKDRTLQGDANQTSEVGDFKMLQEISDNVNNSSPIVRQNSKKSNQPFKERFDPSDKENSPVPVLSYGNRENVKYNLESMVAATDDCAEIRSKAMAGDPEKFVGKQNNREKKEVLQGQVEEMKGSQESAVLCTLSEVRQPTEHVTALIPSQDAEEVSKKTDESSQSGSEQHFHENFIMEAAKEEVPTVDSLSCVATTSDNSDLEIKPAIQGGISEMIKGDLCSAETSMEATAAAVAGHLNEVQKAGNEENAEIQTEDSSKDRTLNVSLESPVEAHETANGTEAESTELQTADTSKEADTVMPVTPESKEVAKIVEANADPFKESITVDELIHLEETLAVALDRLQETADIVEDQNRTIDIAPNKVQEIAEMVLQSTGSPKESTTVDEMSYQDQHLDMKAQETVDIGEATTADDLTQNQTVDVAPNKAQELEIRSVKEATTVEEVNRTMDVAPDGKHDTVEATTVDDLALNRTIDQVQVLEIQSVKEASTVEEMNRTMDVAPDGEHDTVEATAAENLTQNRTIDIGPNQDQELEIQSVKEATTVKEVNRTMDVAPDGEHDTVEATTVDDLALNRTIDQVQELDIQSVKEASTVDEVNLTMDVAPDGEHDAVEAAEGLTQNRTMDVSPDEVQELEIQPVKEATTVEEVNRTMNFASDGEHDTVEATTVDDLAQNRKMDVSPDEVQELEIQSVKEAITVEVVNRTMDVAHVELQEVQKIVEPSKEIAAVNELTDLHPTMVVAPNDVQEVAAISDFQSDELSKATTADKFINPNITFELAPNEVQEVAESCDHQTAGLNLTMDVGSNDFVKTENIDANSAPNETLEQSEMVQAETIELQTAVGKLIDLNKTTDVVVNESRGSVETEYTEAMSALSEGQEQAEKVELQSVGRTNEANTVDELSNPAQSNEQQKVAEIVLAGKIELQSADNHEENAAADEFTHQIEATDPVPFSKEIGGNIEQDHEKTAVEVTISNQNIDTGTSEEAEIQSNNTHEKSAVDEFTDQNRAIGAAPISEKADVEVFQKTVIEEAMQNQTIDIATREEPEIQSPDHGKETTIGEELSILNQTRNVTYSGFHEEGERTESQNIQLQTTDVFNEETSGGKVLNQTVKVLQEVAIEEPADAFQGAVDGVPSQASDINEKTALPFEDRFSDKSFNVSELQNFLSHESQEKRDECSHEDATETANESKKTTTPESTHVPVSRSTPMNNSLQIRNGENISLSPFSNSYTDQPLIQDSSEVSSIKCPSESLNANLWISPPSLAQSQESESATEGRLIDTSLEKPMLHVDEKPNSENCTDSSSSANKSNLENVNEQQKEKKVLDTSTCKEHSINGFGLPMPVIPEESASTFPGNDDYSFLNLDISRDIFSENISSLPPRTFSNDSFFSLKDLVAEFNAEKINKSVDHTQSDMEKAQCANTSAENVLNGTVTIDQQVLPLDSTITHPHCLDQTNILMPNLDTQVEPARPESPVLEANETVIIEQQILPLDATITFTDCPDNSIVLDISLSNLNTTTMNGPTTVLNETVTIEQASLPLDSTVAIEEKVLPLDSTVTIEEQVLPLDSTVAIEEKVLSLDSTVTIEEQVLPLDSTVNIEEQVLPLDSTIIIEQQVLPLDSTITFADFPDGVNKTNILNISPLSLDTTVVESPVNKMDATVTIEQQVPPLDSTITVSDFPDKFVHPGNVSTSCPVAAVPPFMMLPPNDAHDDTIFVDKLGISGTKLKDFDFQTDNDATFIDPFDFDLLENLVHPSTSTGDSRTSLYVRFDPLYQPTAATDPSQLMQFIANGGEVKRSEKESASKIVRQIASLHARMERNKIETEQKEMMLSRKMAQIDEIMEAMAMRLKETESRTEKLSARSKKIDHNLKQLTRVGCEYQSVVEIAQAQLKSLLNKNAETPGISEVSTEITSIKQHLHVAETSFIDIVAKYENVRRVAETKRKCVGKLKGDMTELGRDVNRVEELIKVRKIVAETEVEGIKQNIVKLNEQFPLDASRLTALLRKAELSVKNHQDSMDKLEQENRELVALCDDVIADRTTH